MFDQMQNPFAPTPAAPAKKAKSLSSAAMQSIEDGEPNAEAVRHMKSTAPTRWEVLKGFGEQNKAIIALGERVKRLEDTLQAEQDAAEGDLSDLVDDFLGDR
nr:hypothetical protein [uncultured Ruegeria sp.]